MTVNKNIILSEIFGISITDASTLINNTKTINKGSLPGSIENEYEFELRFSDGPKKDCSLNTFMTLSLDDFHEILYSDDVFITYNTPVRNTRIREVYKQKDYIDKLQNNKTDIIRSIMKKTNICTVISKKSSQTQSRYKTIPIAMKLNVENVIDESLFELEEVTNYQRRQRISYMSNKPLLSNWRVDKTVRFYTCEHDNKKLLFNKLTKENVINPKYYDSLDIEFEYIGDFINFEESLYKLFEVIYPDNFRVFNIQYNNLANIIHSSYDFNLQDVFTQVGIVTNSFIKNENINEYVYEEKYDGERVILLCVNMDNVFQIYEYTKTYFKEIYSHNEIDKKSTIYILDAEKLTINGKHKYVVFDCLIHDRQNLNTKPYTERLQYVSKFVENFNDILDVVCVNCYTIKAENEDEVYSRWKKLLHITRTRRTSITDGLKDVKIDGLILHKNDSNFIDGKIYKLKNVLMMSTDFKLMWIPEKKVYYLYLIGNVRDLLRTFPINNQYSKQHFGYSPMEQTKGIYMLFDTPFIQKSYEYEPVIDWYDDSASINKYMDDELKESIDKLMTKMSKNPMAYHGAIVEMTLYGDTQKWLPMRVRHDKEYSNNYKVGLSNIECIYNRLSPSYCRMSSESKSLDFFYKSMIEKYFNELTEHKSLLWHTSNYDQINNIIHLTPINEVYIVSCDKLVLTKACESVYTFNEDISTLSNRSIVHNKSSTIDVNTIYYSSKSENYINKIYSELLKTNFVEHSINIYIETEFSSMSNDMDNYILHILKILSIGGYYAILSSKRLQKNNSQKLSKVLDNVVTNERLLNETNGEIMYLSVFIKNT